MSFRNKCLESKFLIWKFGFTEVHSNCLRKIFLFTGDDFDSDLSIKPWDSENTSEPDLTKEENVGDCEFSKKEIYSTFIPADLPHNLGALVQKAMDNLKEINKNKS